MSPSPDRGTFPSRSKAGTALPRCRSDRTRHRPRGTRGSFSRRGVEIAELQLGAMDLDAVVRDLDGVERDEPVLVSCGVRPHATNGNRPGNGVNDHSGSRSRRSHRYNSPGLRS